MSALAADLAWWLCVLFIPFLYLSTRFFGPFEFRILCTKTPMCMLLLNDSGTMFSFFKASVADVLLLRPSNALAAKFPVFCSEVACVDEVPSQTTSQ